jgi:integrase
MRLTEKTIAALSCDPGRRDRLVFDDTVPGLGVRVTTAGSKSFLCQFTTTAGVKRRVPLGRWGALSLEQARTAARGILGDVARGADPAADRRAAREAVATELQAARLTLRTLLDDWSSLGLAQQRESYRKEAVRAVSFAFSSYLDRRADAVSRADAVQVLDRLVKNGKHAMAGRTLAYARACYGWACKRDRLTVNPFVGLPIPAAITSRDRVLSAEEVGAIYAAAGMLGWPFGPLVKVLLLTAQRRDEVAGLRWSELSDDLTVWTLPANRAKNGREHVVHLSDEARAVLAAMPRLVGADLVFTTTGTTPVSGFSKAIDRLTVAAEIVRIKQVADVGQKAAAPMPSWRLHDFRRTCVTWLAGAGFPPHVADKLLNHVAVSGLSDVGRVYQRGAFLPERKAALEAWGKHVVACAEGRPASDNVVALAGKGGRKDGA